MSPSTPFPAFQSRIEETFDVTGMENEADTTRGHLEEDEGREGTRREDERRLQKENRASQSQMREAVPIPDLRDDIRETLQEHQRGNQATMAQHYEAFVGRLNGMGGGNHGGGGGISS